MNRKSGYRKKLECSRSHIWLTMTEMVTSFLPAPPVLSLSAYVQLNHPARPRPQWKCSTDPG